MYMVLTIMPIVIIILICVIAVSFVSAKHLTKYILDPITEVDINNIKRQTYTRRKPFFVKNSKQMRKKKTEKSDVTYRNVRTSLKQSVLHYFDMHK